MFIAAAWPIVGIFTSDPEVARHAVACLRTVSVGFMIFGFGMTLSSALNGAGDTWTPTWINIGCFWCFEIPLAYVLAIPLGWGPVGVYAAITIGVLGARRRVRARVPPRAVEDASRLNCLRSVPETIPGVADIAVAGQRPVVIGPRSSASTS